MKVTTFLPIYTMLNPQSPPPQPGAGVRTLNLLHRRDGAARPQLQSASESRIRSSSRDRAILQNHRTTGSQVETGSGDKTTSILAPDVGGTWSSWELF